MKPWIFEDSQFVSTVDRDLLVEYLCKHKIQVEGYFKKALEDDEVWDWRYPAFAVKNFSFDPVLIKKLSLLCRKRGNNNDIERHYQNQLVEFHALYVLVALMGYQFDGWDRKSGADSLKNCDLAFIKDGAQLFADAKDFSGEIVSQHPTPYSNVFSFDPKYVLTGWILKMA